MWPMAPESGERQVDPPDWQAINEELRERYEAVARRAFEEHVLAILKRTAPIAEEGHRRIYGRDETVLFRDAELVRSYPNTAVEIRM